MLLLRNARLSGKSSEPADEAIAISNGRIVAVGTSSELRDLRGPGVSELDLEGRRVVPGLIDGHAHVVRAGLSWSREVRWSECKTLEQALKLIRQRAEDLGPGHWVPVIGGWHGAQFEPRSAPTRAHLDRVAPRNPCYVQLLYDEAILNSAALAQAGLMDPELELDGGTIERDSDRQPTGIVRGPGAFRHCLKQIGAMSFDEQVISTRAMLDELAGYGLTGVLDPGGIGIGPDSYKPLYETWRRGGLPLRLRLYLGAGTPGHERSEIQDWLRYMPLNFGDDRLRITGIGEIILFRCWDGDGLRPLTVDPEDIAEFTELSRLIAAQRWPMHVHAIRDESAGMILDAWERVGSRGQLRPLRFSIAHADAMGEDNLQRARRLGIGLALQNRMVYRGSGSAEAWGETAVADAPPLQRMRELGFPLSGGTDATVASSINPWRSLWWLVTGHTYGGPRRAPQHRLTRGQAIDLYTAGSTWFSFEEHLRGRVTAGYLADLAVLSEDYYGVPEDQIPEIRSELTLVGGDVTHASGSLGDAASDIRQDAPSAI